MAEAVRQGLRRAPRTEVWDAINPRSGGGNSTQFTYDALNRQTSVKDPLGNVVSEVYADNGDVSNRTEQRLLPGASQAVYQTTTYSYDPGHRLTGISYPGVTGMGPVTAPVFVYDGGGRRLFRRDDYGLASYSYDPLGRLTRVISPQENMTLTYDQANNVVALGTSLGTTSYSYDASGRMTGVTDPLGNSSAYHYDGFGRVSQIDLPGGYQRKVEYWTLPSGAATNRLQSIKTDKDTTTYWGGNYQYDYAGHVRQISVSQAVYGQPATYTLTVSYDAADRLTRWTDTSIAPQTTYYSYDAVGNRTAWGNRNPGIQDNHQTPAGTVVNQAATYNAASRVNQQWTTLPNNEKKLGPAAAPNVTYEPNGNLLTESYTAADGSGTATVTNTYNDAGQLVGMTTTAPGTGAAGYTNTETYRYDADGRRVDWSSHLCTEVAGQGCIDTYKQYEYVGSDAVAERGQDGNVSVWYVLGQGSERLYTLHWDTAAVKLVPGVYAKDHLGSIRMLLDTSVQAPDSPVKNAYNYDAFGLPTNQEVALSNSYQLAGGAMDQASMTTAGTSYHYPSLYNLKARLYKPSSGRFLTQDTWKGDPWIPWTLNLYAYVGNNPVNYTDPTGHCIEDLCIGEGLLLYAAGTALVAALTPAIENAAQQLAPYVQEGLTAIGNWEHQAVDSLIAWFSSSKTHWEDLIRIPGGGKALGRLDSEPYGRGRRIHVQWKGSKQKYYWDQGSKQFVDADGSPAPKAINDNDELARQAEKIWNRYNPSPEDQAGGSGDGSSNGGDSSGGS